MNGKIDESKVARHFCGELILIECILFSTIVIHPLLWITLSGLAVVVQFGRYLLRDDT